MAAFGGRCENCEQLHKEGNYCPVCDKARRLSLPRAHGGKLAREASQEAGQDGDFRAPKKRAHRLHAGAVPMQLHAPTNRQKDWAVLSGRKCITSLFLPPAMSYPCRDGVKGPSICMVRRMRAGQTEALTSCMRLAQTSLALNTKYHAHMQK